MFFFFHPELSEVSWYFQNSTTESGNTFRAMPSMILMLKDGILS